MLFSIIVPVYHVEKYLSRCVESIINQTYDDIEIILVDDGGDDDCPRLCDEYAKKDSRITVVHKDNGGLSDARNAGLKIAKGEYIIFVDSDDYIEKNACENLKKYTDLECDVLVAEATVEGAVINLSHIDKPNYIFSGIEYMKESFFNKKRPMAAWLNVYKRIFLINNNLFFKKGILHEDEQFTPRVLLCANSVIVTNVLLYHYIIRNDSIMTKSDKRKNLIDLFSICEELAGLYAKIENKKLRISLLSSLVSKYLTLYVTANAYEYGQSFYHKLFILKNAKTFKTRFQSLVYSINPRIYCELVDFRRKNNE